MPRSPRSQPRGHVSRPWPREGRGEPGSCACSRERLPWRRHGHRRSSGARGRGRGSEMFPERVGRHLRMPFSTGRCHDHSTFPSSLLIPYRGHAGPYALPRASVGRKDAAGPARLRPRRRASAGASERAPADTERHRAHFQRSVPRREPHSPRRAAGAARLSKVSSPRLPPAWAMLGAPPPSISAEKNRGRSSRGGPGPQAAGRGQRWARDPVA